MRISIKLTLLIFFILIFQSCNDDIVAELEDCNVSILIAKNSCTNINFTNSAQVSMKWEVNDKPVKSASSYEFDAIEAGTYEICGYYVTQTCPTETQVCKSIEVGADCFTVTDCSVELTLEENSCSSITLSNSLDLKMDWTVNGNKATEEKVYQFTAEVAGKYEICGSYTTQECPDITEVCTTLEIGESCFVEPDCEVELTQSEVSCSSYSYTNNQEAILDWEVNGAPISSGQEFNFTAQTAGTYEICGSYKTPECPDGTKTCKTIEVTQFCLTPEMCEAQLMKTENTCFNYAITCDYDEIMDWTVNNIPMYSSNVFQFQAETAGTYEICGVNENTECPDGVRACTTIEIGASCFGNEACDFEINIEQMSCSRCIISNSLQEDMKWTANGFQVASGVGFSFEAMVAGSYEICAEFESTDCPEGENKCTTIDIDEDCF